MLAERETGVLGRPGLEAPADLRVRPLHDREGDWTEGISDKCGRSIAWLNH